ncbi:MAG: hypothetical protein QOI61_1547 [Actinomycetota bacterium]
MKYRMRKAVAALAAVALVTPLATAWADTVPVPGLPTLPALPLPITIPPIPNPPTVGYPNPQATLAMLQGQIALIAAALQTTPEALLNQLLATEIPSQGSLVLTVNGLLNRLAGTTVFDPLSNGPLGTTEIAIGNISHAFNMGSLAKPAIDGPRCIPPETVSPCNEAPNPHVATLPTYSKVTSNWLPALPAASVLGTSILLPLINGLTPASPVAIPVTLPVTGVTPGDVPNSVCLTATIPAVCQGFAALIKANISLVSEPGGRLVNIQGGGWTVPDPVTGKTIKKGVHNGGTGALNGSNLDTGFRPGITQADPWPVWLPLLTSTAGLADSSVDFLGFSPATPSVSNTCANNKDAANKTIPTTYSVNDDGVEIAHFPASTCKSSGSFSGFGISLYGPSEGHAPVNFRTDLAPLWDPAPPVVSALSDALAAVVASLTPYLPPTGLTLLAWPPVTFALGLAGVVTNLQGQLLGLQDDLPVEIPTAPELPVPVPPVP